MKLKIPQMVCLLGIALVLVGILLPWAKWPNWGRYRGGSVSGFETADGWILLVFAVIAFISVFKSSDELDIGLLRLFPGIILFLGGELNADVFRGFAFGRIPYEVVEAGGGSHLIMVGGLMIMISGLWELFSYLRMRGY